MSVTAEDLAKINAKLSNAQVRGQGSTVCSVSTQHGCVVLQFPREIAFAAFDPANAVQVAQAMIQAAKDAGYAKPLVWVPPGRA